MLKVPLPVNDKQKQKLKKNALDFVDFDEEKKNDPKYKTELCKSFRDTNFCPYGNRCRFAHGKKELGIKNLDTNKYKQKQCNSFKESGYCLYGSRCNFRHNEMKLENIERSYYSYLLKISDIEEELNPLIHNKSSDSFYRPCFVLNEKTFFQKSSCKSNSKRLDVFANLTKKSENSSTSVSSNDSLSPVQQLKNFSGDMLNNKRQPLMNPFLLSAANNINGQHAHLSFNGNNLIGFGSCGQNNPYGTNVDYNINDFNNCKNNHFGKQFLNQTGFFPAGFLNKTSAI